jgi:DNA-binding TFAR19-related protein (PDSD5 family)
MSEEDKDLERLKAKRLDEMQKNLSSQREKQKLDSSKEMEKNNKPNSRDVVVKQLGYRGVEVLQNAEYQFPNETRMIVAKLAELITSGDVLEVIDGGELLTLFRSIGINVRMKTKIKVEEDGKFVSLSDKLGTKSTSTQGD